MDSLEDLRIYPTPVLTGVPVANENLAFVYAIHHFAGSWTNFAMGGGTKVLPQ